MNAPATPSPNSPHPVKVEDSSIAPATRPGSWLGGMVVVSVMTVLSRILGLVRDIAMARLFGLSPVMDAFTVAFRIPNLSRKLFGEGALATSFIPIFTRELQQSDRATAWVLASAVLGWLTLFLTVLVVLGEWGLAAWIWWGMVTPETRVLIELTALMLPYLVLICLASQVGAVLNSLGHFRWPATVPVILNLVWLISVWWVTPWFASSEAKAWVLGACILVSGVLQVLVQWPTLRRAGFRFEWDWKPVRPQVKEILRTMLPVVLGLSITQINTFADSLIAWGFSHPVGNAQAVMPFWGSPRYPLEAGAVSALYYGERMYQFPLGVFGVALGTAIFPLLAHHAARGEMENLRQDLSLGMRLVLVIGVPASAALVWLAHPIARCLFERGEFTPADTIRTAQIIAAYGCGVWAYCGLLILQRGCYAVGDRATPLKLGLLSVALNLVLNLTLIWFIAEKGLAVSTSLCAMLQVAALVWTMQKRVGQLDWGPLQSCAFRTMVATILMSAAGMGLMIYCQRDARLSGKFVGLTVPCLGAALTYLVAAWILRLDELWMLVKKRT
jgi:putative peptidoglycan lipid II flippase